MFELGQHLLILALLLPLQLQDLSIGFFLHFAFFFLQVALEVPLEVVKLHVELGLNLAFFSLQALDVTSFAVELLVLLIFELLNFKLIELLLALFNCFSNAFVTASELQLLRLQLLIQLPLEVG